VGTLTWRLVSPGEAPQQLLQVSVFGEQNVVIFYVDCLLLFEQYFQEEVQREAAGAAEIDPSHQEG
jgi:hypothetical protein